MPLLLDFGWSLIAMDLSSSSGPVWPIASKSYSFYSKMCDLMVGVTAGRVLLCLCESTAILPSETRLTRLTAQSRNMVSSTCIGTTITLIMLATTVVMNNVDPSSGKRKEAKSKSKAAFEKLGLTEPLDLSEHEEIIMGEVIGARDITSTFSGICCSLPRPATRKC